MQTSISSPDTANTSDVQSLDGQTFAGVVSEKTNDSLIIAIAHADGVENSVSGVLPKDCLIGFTPAIKEQRFALMESGARLYVRVHAFDSDPDTSPGVLLSEVSSLR